MHCDQEDWSFPSSLIVYLGPAWTVELAFGFSVLPLCIERRTIGVLSRPRRRTEYWGRIGEMVSMARLMPGPRNRDAPPFRESSVS